MKNSKKSIAILVAMLLCFSCLSLTVSARWTSIISTYDCLTMKTPGILHCDGDVDVYPGYSAKLTMELQRYTGGSWNTIKTWTATGAYYAGLCENWPVSSGYQYRLKLTNQALTSSGAVNETFIDYSNSIIY